MKQLKQILIERVKDILEVQSLIGKNVNSQFHHNSRYDFIIEQKRAERQRYELQNNIFLILSNLNAQDQSYLSEIFHNTLDIFSLYNCDFVRKRQSQGLVTIQSLVQLYKDFFILHGFSEKSQYINNYFSKKVDKNSTCINYIFLFFGWLSQWSKKTYSNSLHKLLYTSTFNKEKAEKLSQNSFTFGFYDHNKTSFKKMSNHNHNQSNIVNQLPELSICNRNNIQGLFLDDLQSYYKLVAISGVDHMYLKSLRKKPGKEDLIKAPNLSKAVLNMIQSSGNKQIQNIMKQYEKQYLTKFPEPKVKSMKKQIEVKEKQPLSKKQTQLQHENKSNSRVQKVFIYSPMKKKIKNITEIEDLSTNQNYSKLLSPKCSQIEFMPVEDSDWKYKKVRFLNYYNRVYKNSFELPGIVKKDNFKSDLKAIVMERSFNDSKISRGKSQVKHIFKTTKDISLELKLKEKNFLKCEGVLSRSKIGKKQQINGLKYQGFEGSSRSIKIKTSGNIENMKSQTEDPKVKWSKIFELEDLKYNNKKACNLNKPLLQILK